jgi:hypothetical protein
MDEERKEGRPSELEETIDLDLPQDPGIPNRDDEERAADTDETLPPGSMPPGSEREHDRPDDETVRA